ncbi:MAG: hypothetical protein ACI8P9_005178 [Parasphingorhabdus sp.]|jgi:hypothetical protein
MNLLNLPEIQSGAIPFVVALIVALLLRNRWPQWSGLGALAGFYMSAASMGVLDLMPTRSANRILLLGLVFVLLGSVIDLFAERCSKATNNCRPKLIGALVLALVLGISWLIYKTVARQDAMEMSLTLIFATTWTAWVGGWLLTLNTQPLRLYSAVMVLALATGICTALGASILLGQLAIGLSAACGAILLVACFSDAQRVPYKFIAAVAILCSAIGVAGVIFAKVSWFTLLILAALPLVVRLPLPTSWPRLAQATLASVFAAFVGSAAIYLAWWQSAQSSSPY